MLEDLTMIATLPVDENAVKKAEDEADKDKAAGGQTMPARTGPPSLAKRASARSRRSASGAWAESRRRQLGAVVR